MSSSDDLFPRATARSPSGWHDDGPGRDAGHDEMQAEQLRVWRSGDTSPIMREGRRTAGKRPYFIRASEAEVPFTGYRDRITGFADIGLRFDTEESDQDAKLREWHLQRYGANPPPDLVYVYEPESFWIFLELKPRIASVGAVIRQCKATAQLALPKYARNFEVWAVVYEDDPKADLLKEMYDGIVICLPRRSAEVAP